MTRANKQKTQMLNSVQLIWYLPCVIAAVETSVRDSSIVLVFVSVSFKPSSDNAPKGGVAVALAHAAGGERLDDTTLSTAMVTAAALKKNAVITADTPGFVVNRVLAKVLGEAMHAVDDGTPFETVDQAFAPLGLPMAPSALLDLVGLRVGAHVLDTHHAAFPDRFYRSENLHRLAEHGTLLEKDAKGKIKGLDKGAAKILSGGKSPWTKEDILRRLEDGLADEIHRMLGDDHVVEAPEDIDLCMILGAGFAFQMGGITPYLDRVGASERAFGDTFHHPVIKGVA